MICKNCGRDIPDEGRFCPVCGALTVSQNDQGNSENHTNANNAQVSSNNYQASANETQVSSNNYQASANETQVGSNNYQASANETQVSSNNYQANANETQVNSNQATYYPTEPEVVNPASFTPELIAEPKKKNIFSRIWYVLRGGKGKAVPVIASIVAVLGVLAVTYAASTTVRNTLAKLFLSETDYFQYVMKNNTEDVTEDISEIAGMIRDGGGNFEGAQANIDLEVGGGLKELLDAAEVDGEIYENIKWAKNVSLSADVDASDTAIALKNNIKLNEKNIGNVNLFADMKGGKVLFGSPDLNSEYVGEEIDAPEDIIKIVKGIFKVLPDNKTMNQILNRYALCVIKELKDIDEDKGQIKAGGITQKCTVLTVSIGDKEVRNIIKSVLEQFENDEDIEKIVDDLADVSPDFKGIKQSYKEMLAGIDSAIDSASNIKFDETYKVKIFVNGQGRIAGYSFELDESKILCQITQKGNKFGLCMEMYEGEDGIKIEGSGSASLSKKLSGDFTADVKMSGISTEVVKISVEDLDLKRLSKEKVFNGKMTIEPSGKGVSLIPDQTAKEILKKLKISITGNAEAAMSIDNTIEVIYGDKNCLTLKLKGNLKESGAEINMPSSFVGTSDYRGLQEWVDNADFDTIIDRLSGAGVPEWMLDELEGSIPR